VHLIVAANDDFRCVRESRTRANLRERTLTWGFVVVGSALSIAPLLYIGPSSLTLGVPTGGVAGSDVGPDSEHGVGCTRPRAQ